MPNIQIWAWLPSNWRSTKNAVHWPPVGAGIWATQVREPWNQQKVFLLQMFKINHLALFLLRPKAPRQQQDLHSNPAHILPTEVRDGHLNSQAAFTWGINVDQSEVFPEIKTLTRILDEA